MSQSTIRRNGRLPAILLLIGCALAVLAGQAQETAGRPRFEVASIKLNPKCRPGQGMPGPPSPGRLQLACMTVQDLIQVAYVRLAKKGVPLSAQELEITGGPEWIQSDQYDLTAKAEGDAGERLMNGPMMQSLLEDRFHLRIHRSTKEGAVYALVAAKGGLTLQPAQEGGCVIRDLDHLPPPPEPGKPTPAYCGEVKIGMGQQMTLEGRGMTMAGLADGLSFDGVLDRPVIDQTGFTGRFDFHLKSDRGSMGGGKKGGGGNGGPPAGIAGPSLLADALAQQLGLKLVPVKGPVEFLVIDHIERPSAN